jgi:hypothetical protein
MWRSVEWVDVLIHEATFADDVDPRKAHEEGHSTVADAVEAARALKASVLILTHVSARYPDKGDTGPWRGPPSPRLTSTCRRTSTPSSSSFDGDVDNGRGEGGQRPQVVEPLQPPQPETSLQQPWWGATGGGRRV